MIELSKLEEWEDWIPDGEREAYERAPKTATVMELRFLSKENRDHYQRLAKKYKSQGMVSSADVKAARDLFNGHVRNIRNMRIGGVDIIDGGQLFDVDGVDALHVEIIGALHSRSTLEEGLAKKFKPASVSTSSHQTASAGGGAVDATLKSPPTIQAAPARMVSLGSPMPTNGSSEAATASQPVSSTSGSRV